MATADILTSDSNVDEAELPSNVSDTTSEELDFTCQRFINNALLNNLIRQIIQNGTIISDVWRQEIEAFCNPTTPGNASAISSTTIATAKTTMRTTTVYSTMSEEAIIGIAFGAAVGALVIVFSVLVAMVFIRKQR